MNGLCIFIFPLFDVVSVYGSADSIEKTEVQACLKAALQAVPSELQPVCAALLHAIAQI